MAKVLVTLEDNLLRHVDRTVRERGLTRSTYLAGLARRDLEQQRGPGADPEVRAALTRLDDLFKRAGTPGDPAELIRRMRDSR